MSASSHSPYSLYIPELHIRCSNDKKLFALSHIAQDIMAQTRPTSILSGVHVIMEDGWWMVRADDHDPALIVRAQASSEAGLAHLKRTLANHLDRVCLDFPLSHLD
ncbi:MAG: hypothetical protein JKY27_01310 [Magnetovibrio sp.]|nr:hypothetical protein [Magnetovibrio sp.]